MYGGRLGDAELLGGGAAPADMAKYRLNGNFDYTACIIAGDAMPTTGKKGSMTSGMRTTTTPSGTIC